MKQCIPCILKRIKENRKLLAMAPEGSEIHVEILRRITADELLIQSANK